MNRIPFFVVLWLITANWAVAQQGRSAVMGRTTLHPDGTKTETVTNPETRELEEKTYDGNGVMITRKLCLLNERGQVVQGNIYDGANNLQARVQVYFDEVGRATEDRLTNLAGEVFQQTIYKYGPGGKALPPQVVNYNVRSPTMRPAMIDFRQMTPSPPTGGGQPAAAGARPAQPSAQPAAPARPQEPPKRSLWKRLFGGKN